MAKPFKCEVCNKRFGDKHKLASHQNVHTTVTPFACPQCPYRGKTKKYLARHTKQVHGKAGDKKCKVCGKLFLHQSGLRVHEMVHTGEKPHSCKVCGKTFRVTYSLNSHMLIHKDVKPFQCSFCDYACRDSSTLRKHQNKHMGLEKIYECKICSKGYRSRAALKIHIAEIHLDVDVRKFPCSQCDRVFKTNAHRKMHIDAIHERALVCNCPVCGRRLLNKNNLTAHMRTHLEERPFGCAHPGCKIAFKDKNSLTKHSVIHKPELHFECTYCSRKFARKTHVQRHERVMHVERQKKYQCDYCGSKFYSKNYLLKHIQTKHVHKQKFKYICDLCGLITHNKPSIVMHLKYGHANDNDLQCKLCDNKKVYKRHLYLKLHYWNTHSMRYKITRPATNTKAARKEKEDKASVEIKVEPIESDSYEELQLLDVHKQENEDDEESLGYSKRVLSEDITESVLRERGISTKEVDFDDFFIRHVFAKQENQPEEMNIDGVNEEQNKYVKERIKQILKKTEIIAKGKAAKEKRKEEKFERKKRAIEEAKLRRKREKEELVELRRVREVYNERMKAAVSIERGKKDQLKIKYFKKVNDTNQVNKTAETNDISKDTAEIETKIVAIDKAELFNTITEETDKYTENNESANNISVSDDISKLNDVENDEITNTSRDKDTINVNAVLTEEENREIDKVAAYNGIFTEENNKNNEYTNNSVSNDISNLNDDTNDTDDQETIKENTVFSKKDDEYETLTDNFETVNANNEGNNETDSSVMNCEDENQNHEIEVTKISDLNEKHYKHDNNKVDGEIGETTDDINNSKNIVSDDDDDGDLPLQERRLKMRGKHHKYDDNDESWNDSDEEVNDNGKAKKIKFKTFQCYVCFKLYQTKQALIEHCQTHFNICHDRTLTKCPICNHVSHKGISNHMKKKHDMDIKIPFNKLKHRTDTDTDGSKYCYNIQGTIVEVIPSVNTLNKVASDDIDKKRRELTSKSIARNKLVKKGNGWIVEKETIKMQFNELPELTDRELHKLKVTDNDVDRLGQLGYIARNKGLKMMFPCFKCDKICQNFSALKLHQRRHEDNPKPFKPKVYGAKKPMDVKIKLNTDNRTAFPKPILNKHKCDAKLKAFYESNIRGRDVEFWQFLKIYNRINREGVKDFEELEQRSDFGNHLDYYKDAVVKDEDEVVTKEDEVEINEDEVEFDEDEVGINEDEVEINKDEVGINEDEMGIDEDEMEVKEGDTS